MFIPIDRWLSFSWMASQMDSGWNLTTQIPVSNCKRNLPLATTHREVVEEYLQYEISIQSVAGPFH